MLYRHTCICIEYLKTKYLPFFDIFYRKCTFPIIVFDEYLLTAEIFVEPNSVYKGSKRIIIDNKTDEINMYPLSYIIGQKNK